MTEEDYSLVQISFLRNYVARVFEGIGVPPGDAETCTDVLLDADLKGFDTHGVNRLKPVYYDRVRSGLQSPTSQPQVVRDGPTTAVVDARNGMGMVAAKKSMDICMEKAGKYGLGMVAVRNSTHFGIAGYYSEMASRRGLIGVTGTNARPAVAPTFGVEPMLGTNPLTFSMPTDEPFPFTLDCATSIIQRGKVEVYSREGKQLPEGVVIGEEGRPLRDPDEVLRRLLLGEASLLPLGGAGEETGGYKGYGYATVVEILSSSLQAGNFLTDINGVNLGHFFMAIDVSAFTEPKEFKKTTGDILRTLRSARRAPGMPRIYTAGEKEYLKSQERIKRGIPVNGSVQRELAQMRDELELTGFRFPFEEG